MIKILLMAAAALNFGVQAVYFTHMLQLNSYRPERYKRWCTEHDKELVNIRRLLPFLCVLLLFSCMWSAMEDIHSQLPKWLR